MVTYFFIKIRVGVIRYHIIRKVFVKSGFVLAIRHIIKSGNIIGSNYCEYYNKDTTLACMSLVHLFNQEVGCCLVLSYTELFGLMLALSVFWVYIIAFGRQGG